MREVTDPQLLAMLDAGDLPESPMASYGPAVRHVESRGNRNAVSRAGAVGADQFMPATAAAMGLTDPRDPVMSAVARDLLLAENYDRFKDPMKALQAYNVGPGAVASGRPLPKETQEYAPKVMAAMGMKEVTDPAILAQLNGQQSQEQPKKSALPQATKKSTARQAAESTLAEMSFPERLLVGAGKSVADVGRTFGLLKDDAKEADAALTDDTAGMIGNVAGEVAMTAVPGGAAYKAATAVPRLAKATSLAGRTARMAAGGAAAGAAGEAVMGRDPLEGAAIGAAAGPVLEHGLTLATRGLKGARNLLGGAETAAAQKVQRTFDDPAAAAARLDALQPEVPGERLTTGMAASPEYPEFKVYEQIARRSPQARELLSADEANQAARLALLEPTAARARPGTATTNRPVPDSPAEAARRAATAPLYDRAQRSVVTLSPETEAMLMAPEAERMVRSGQLSYAQSVANDPRLPSPGAWSDPDNGMPAVFNISELQAIKKELSDEIARVAPNDRSLAHRLNQVRQALTREMEAQSPNYREATAKYRVLSQPQNRGEVMQQLINAAESPAGVERATAYLRALREAPGTIKRGTGDTRFQQLEQVMTPGQMKRIQAVERSLRRQAEYDALPVQESIVPKTKSAFEKIEDVLPPVFSQAITTVRRALRVVGQRSDEEVDRIINKAVADPAEFSQLLKLVPPGERMKIINLMTEAAKQNPELSGMATATFINQAQE